MKKTLSFEKDLTFQTMIGEVTTISFEEDLKFIDKSNIAGNFYISGQYKMTEASTLLEDFSFNIPIEIALLENYDLETAKISIMNFTYEIIDDDTLRSKVDVLVEGREEVVVEEKEEVIEELTEKEEQQEVRIIEEKEDRIEKVADLESNKEEINEEIIEERECDGEIKEEDEQELPIKKEQLETHQLESITQEIEEKIEEKKQTIEKKEIAEQKVEQSSKRDDDEKETSTSIKVNSLFSNLSDTSDTFTTYSVYIMREGDNLEKVMDKYKVKKEELEVYNDLSTIELNSKVIIPTNSDE